MFTLSGFDVGKLLERNLRCTRYKIKRDLVRKRSLQFQEIHDSDSSRIKRCKEKAQRMISNEKVGRVWDIEDEHSRTLGKIEVCL